MSVGPLWHCIDTFFMYFGAVWFGILISLFIGHCIMEDNRRRWNFKDED